MEYAFGALMIAFVLLCYYQNNLLKNRIKQLEQRLNQIAVNTNNEILAFDYVSIDLKALLVALKTSEGDVAAVKKLREETGMSLLDAKQYVDHID